MQFARFKEENCKWVNNFTALCDCWTALSGQVLKVEVGKRPFNALIKLSMSPNADVCSCCSIHEPQEQPRRPAEPHLSRRWDNAESHAHTYIACIGERPGLLSLPLLFVCSIAPLSSSLITLAKLPRVGFPMEAVVYRGILFSAIEACQGHKQIYEEPWLTFLYFAQHARFQNILHIYFICNYHLFLNIVLSDRYCPDSTKGNLTSFTSGFKFS